MSQSLQMFEFIKARENSKLDGPEFFCFGQNMKMPFQVNLFLGYTLKGKLVQQRFPILWQIRLPCRCSEQKQSFGQTFAGTTTSCALDQMIEFFFLQL